MEGCYLITSVALFCFALFSCIFCLLYIAAALFTLCLTAYFFSAVFLPDRFGIFPLADGIGGAECFGLIRTVFNRLLAPFSILFYIVSLLIPCFCLQAPMLTWCWHGFMQKHTAPLRVKCVGRTAVILCLAQEMLPKCCLWVVYPHSEVQTKCQSIMFPVFMECVCLLVKVSVHQDAAYLPA